jgi:excisionase family DNA binding protein
VTDLTTTQAAARLGITPRRVQALIALGRLFPGARKVGRDWLIPAREVEAARGRKAGRPTSK